MKLLFTLGALAIVGVLLFNSFDPVQVERRASQAHYEQERNLLDIQRQQLDLERYAATQPARVVNDYAFGALLIVGGLVLLVVAVDGYVQRRRPLTRFGGYPVSRELVTAGDPALVALLSDAIRAAGVAAIEEARRPGPVAHSLTYAPRYAGGSTIESAEVGETHLSQIPAVPSFADLLARGRVGKGNPLILGFDTATGAELSGSWLDLYSTVVSGLPGTGKTTTQRFLACQTALQGARFAVIDPHMGAADDSLAATLSPLSSAFVCEPASTNKAILDVVRYVADVGRRRVEGKDRTTIPLILWADELTSLLGRSSIGDELAMLLEQVAQEFRKRFVFICGSGQIFTASRATSELRDSFASAIVHRMRRNQARLLLPTEEAAQVERLETGRAVLWRTSGATQTIVVPNTTASDVRQVAALLTDSQPTIATSSVKIQSGFSHDDAADYPAVGRAEPPTPEAARVIALFLAGKDAGQIVTELYQMQSRAGAPYLRKLSEVQAVIRSALARA